MENFTITVWFNPIEIKVKSTSTVLARIKALKKIKEMSALKVMDKKSVDVHQESNDNLKKIVTMQHNIHNELNFSIRILAERAIWDVRESKIDFQAFDLAEMYATIAPKLVRRAEVCFSENHHFRNIIKQRQNDSGRIKLLLYMHTWTLDLLKRKTQPA